MKPVSIRKQQGAVLVTGLIVLVVLTLLVVALVRTSVLQLKIGGANQLFVANEELAQNAIDQYIAQYSIGRRFAVDCETAPTATGCIPISTSGTNSISLAGNQRLYYGFADKASLNVAPVGCILGGGRGSGDALGSGPSTIYFEVRGSSSSNLFGGQAQLRQGVYALGPPTVCNNT